MEKEDLKTKNKPIICSVRINKEQSVFMKKNKLSPGVILRKALDELMKKER